MPVRRKIDGVSFNPNREVKPGRVVTATGSPSPFDKAYKDLKPTGVDIVW